MKMKELVCECDTLLRRYEARMTKFGRTIVNVLKDIIPDLSFSLGWTEQGIDVICFWADERFYDTTRPESLPQIIDEFVNQVVPDKFFEISAPWGVWVTKEEAEEIRKRLRKLFEEE